MTKKQRKEQTKEKGKEQRNKIKWIVIIILLVITIALLYFLYQSGDILAPSQLSNDNFEYLSFSIQNQSYLKENCAFIRVGRCDKLGEEFGKECWFRPVIFSYNLIGILSDKNLLCEAQEQGNVLGISEFKDSTLTFDLDIRKQNQIDVCCWTQKDNELSNQVCFETIKTQAIC